MAKIRRLKDERDAYMFLQAVLGDVNLIEGLADRLDDPNEEFSSNNLMFMHFDKAAKAHRDFLGNQQKVAEFVRLYPGYSHLVQAAGEMADSFDRLHIVRESLLVPYLRADGQDIQRYERPAGLSDHNERGLANGGLTAAQQEAFEDQLDRYGFVKLTSTERQQLRNAILAELE